MDDKGLVAEEKRDSKCGRAVGLVFRLLCNDRNNGRAREDLGSMSERKGDGVN